MAALSTDEPLITIRDVSATTGTTQNIDVLSERMIFDFSFHHGTVHEFRGSWIRAEFIHPWTLGMFWRRLGPWSLCLWSLCLLSLGLLSLYLLSTGPLN